MNKVKPYSGELTAIQAASAMQAARMNALDLMDTAAILHDLKRFAHSVLFSTLAIEEAGKLPIILSIFLGFTRDHSR
jgi:AbiV family abortive infection protein